MSPNKNQAIFYLAIFYIFYIFLQNHFLQDDHHGFLEDVEVTLIDKTQASDLTKRKYYWMRTLKTLYPDGLNLESDY